MSLWQSVKDEFRRCCDLLLPPACQLCSARLPIDMPAADFCPACLAGWPQPAPACCPVCAVAYPAPFPSRHHCAACLRQPPPFVQVHAVGPYAGTLQEAVQRFKYRGQLTLDRPLGNRLVAALRAGHATRPHLIIPVPLHRERLRSRGYNQALQLARQIGRQVDVPVVPDLLRRTRATAPQQGLAAAARHNNLRGAFATQRSLGGQRILLVDDVMTTGTTARECAAVLRAAGAAAIEVAVLGRA